MNIFSRSVLAAAGLCAAFGLAACAGAGTEGVSFSRPGKYNLYNCALLNETGTTLVKREQELEGLMQKVFLLISTHQFMLIFMRQMILRKLCNCHLVLHLKSRRNGKG